MMEQERYNELCKQEGAIPLGHPEFDAQEYHRSIWIGNQTTIVICQRKTKEVTQLCVESILKHYPDIPILVIDGDSQDDSTLYLRYKALTVPNFTLYERIGMRNSHGETLHDAFMNHVETAFALTMDSDTIVNRSGFIEGLIGMFSRNPKLYAAGHLMLVSKSNFGCDAPKDEEDILRYAHPECSMFHVPTYKSLGTPFNDNGAPLAHNMIIAGVAGLEIGAFPIDKYSSHRMGTSWVTEHQIIWKDDYDIQIRPFVTFIVTKGEQIAELEKQTDKDFDIIIQGDHIDKRVWVDNAIDLSNRFYQMRFKANGEYVCLLNEAVSAVDSEFVHNIKLQVIENKVPDELVVGGIRIVKRKVWQLKDCLS